VLLLHHTQLDDLDGLLEIEEQASEQKKPLEGGKPCSAPYDESTTEPLSRHGEEQPLAEDERTDLETASAILGVPLDQKRLARWRKDRAALSAMGLDFRLHVVPAMQQAVSKAEKHNKCLQITSLMYFEIPAKGIATGSLQPPPVPTDFKTFADTYATAAPPRSIFGRRR
jgi:hypothetical protein